MFLSLVILKVLLNVVKLDCADHSPVSVSFQFHNSERGPGTWKFNNSLLYDPDYVTLVKNCRHEVILQYSVPTQDEDLTFSINDQLLWEIKTNDY
jgi:hypothetical protein